MIPLTGGRWQVCLGGGGVPERAEGARGFVFLYIK